MILRLFISICDVSLVKHLSFRLLILPAEIIQADCWTLVVLSHRKLRYSVSLKTRYVTLSVSGGHRPTRVRGPILPSDLRLLSGEGEPTTRLPTRRSPRPLEGACRRALVEFIMPRHQTRAQLAAPQRCTWPPASHRRTSLVAQPIYTICRRARDHDDGHVSFAAETITAGPLFFFSVAVSL
jgi:hypothetical protein